MPKPEKVSEDARSVSNATANDRKIVSSILDVSDEELIDFIRSMPKDELLRLAPVLRVFFSLLISLKEE